MQSMLGQTFITCGLVNNDMVTGMLWLSLCLLYAAASTNSQDPDLRPERARLAYSSTLKVRCHACPTDFQPVIVYVDICTADVIELSSQQSYRIASHWL